MPGSRNHPEDQGDEGRGRRRRSPSRSVSRSPTPKSKYRTKPRSHSRSRSRSQSERFSRRNSRSPPSRSRRGRSDSRSPRKERSRSRSESDRDRPQACRVLGVFGLNYQTSKRDLERAFERYGKLDRVDLVTDPSGMSRGFGFVSFEDIQDAKDARSAMADKIFDGKKIRVDYSISQGPHNKTPGRYMGNRSRNFDRDGRWNDSYRSYDRGYGDRYGDYRRSPRRSPPRSRDSYSRDRGRRDYY